LPSPFSLPVVAREREERRRKERRPKTLTFTSFSFLTSLVPFSLSSLVASAQYELTLGHLDNAELQVEDLKIQLDDALGAEEMLEALTEKNLEMGEVRRVLLPSLSSLLGDRSADLFLPPSLRFDLQKLEEMRIAIEDLESLKDLNDELEENHVETEKQLQEEIGEFFCFPSSLSSSSSSRRLTVLSFHSRRSSRPPVPRPEEAS